MDNYRFIHVVTIQCFEDVFEIRMVKNNSFLYYRFILLYQFLGKRSIIFGCTKLMQLASSIGISEMHVDATFKAVPVNMGNFLLSIHCTIRNYVSYNC